MAPHIKQRVTGIVVLVILIILVIPLLFTGSKKSINSSGDATIPPAPAKPVITAITTQPTWAIQLASFINKSNADKLVQKLQSKGFSAYTKQIKTAKGTIMYQIFIGPEVDRAKAAELLQDLQNSLHLNGLIVRYEI